MLEGIERLIYYCIKKEKFLHFSLRYLCEYVYYQSLFIDSKRTMFIHIPDIDNNFTIENLAQTIQLIIYEALRYVDPLPLLNEYGNYSTTTNLRSMKNERI